VYENMLGLGLKLAWKVVIDEMLSAFHLFNISATTNIYSSIPVLTPSNLWIYLYSFTLFIMKSKEDSSSFEITSTVHGLIVYIKSSMSSYPS